MIFCVLCLVCILWYALKALDEDNYTAAPTRAMLDEVGERTMANSLFDKLRAAARREREKRRSQKPRVRWLPLRRNRTSGGSGIYQQAGMDEAGTELPLARCATPPL